MSSKRTPALAILLAVLVVAGAFVVARSRLRADQAPARPPLVGNAAIDTSQETELDAPPDRAKTVEATARHALGSAPDPYVVEMQCRDVADAVISAIQVEHSTLGIMSVELGPTVRITLTPARPLPFQWSCVLANADFFEQRVSLNLSTKMTQAGPFVFHRPGSFKGRVENLTTDEAPRAWVQIRGPVALDPDGAEDWRRAPSFGAKIDDAGQFAFPRLQAGRFLCRAQSPSQLSAPVFVTVEEGRDSGAVLLTLVQRPSKPSFTVRVVDMENEPVSNAHIVAKIDLLDQDSTEELEGQTDREGLWTFASHEWMRIRIHASPPGDGLNAGPASMEVSSSLARETTVVLPYLGNLILVVTDSSGAPVRHVDWIRIEDPAERNPWGRSTTVDSRDGTYIVSDVADRTDVSVGSWTVGWGRASVPCCKETVRVVPVRLTASMFVHGRVMHDGITAPGATVSLIQHWKTDPLLDPVGRMLAGHPFEPRTRCRAQVVAGVNGEYTIAPQEHGEYSLEVDFDARGSVATPAFSLEEGASKVLDLELESSGSMTVHVPLPPSARKSFACLSVQRVGGPWAGPLVTDEQGVCALASLVTGLYEVKLDRIDSGKMSKEAERSHYFSVPTKTAIGVNVPPDKSAVRHVRVHFPEGNHLRNAVLYCTSGDPIRVDPVSSVVQPHTGGDLLAGEPGPHAVFVEIQGRYSRTRFLRDVVLADEDVDLEFDPGVSTATAVVGASAKWVAKQTWCRRIDADRGQVYYQFGDVDSKSVKGKRAYSVQVPPGEYRGARLEGGRLVLSKSSYLLTSGSKVEISMD